MVTKGIVEKVLSKYYARVRIPIYDGVEDSQGSTNNVNLSSAIVCSLPNSIVTLAKDDIVYVTFEDDDIGKPVIIGWLQKGTGNNSEVGLTLSTLTTKSTTFLDKQTYIGNIQPFEIQKLENVRDNIQGQIDLANSNIDDVKTNVENISIDIETINNDLTPIREALNDYNISKGTVEQRLTNLGFREGSITLASGITATTNYLKRQGNYVIGKLVITNGLSYGHSLPYYNGEAAMVNIHNFYVGYLSDYNLFRPNSNIQASIEATSKIITRVLSATTSLYGSAFSKLRMTLSTNGSLSLDIFANKNITSTESNYSLLCSEDNPITITFAYEATPIIT